jgi:hypothetical protein
MEIDPVSNMSSASCTIWVSNLGVGILHELAKLSRDGWRWHIGVCCHNPYNVAE